MSAAPAIGEPSTLKNRLGSVRVAVREDLEVSRHLFRGRPTYIVRDPMTFQSQRLTPADYELLVSIRGDRTLGELFARLVQSDHVTTEDEDRFYSFVLELHGLGFLHLPLNDHRLLHKRFLAKRHARRREKLLGFLFLRIPVLNPDAFLDRTIHWFRPLFSRTMGCIWLAVMLLAAYVAGKHWSALLHPGQGLLATHNLVLMWFTLIALKVCHEFGHAYACKHFGGHVPEMGIYLILFTPCAYVDATASWGFARKRERMMVCLAGMYVESFLAAGALLVWAFTDWPLLTSVAYNVIFLASIVTVLFNINPLLRYDGYYLLSDLLEIPNLRARSTRYLHATLKRLLLGIRAEREAEGGRLGLILLAYGVASGLYRVTLIFAIAAILATRMLVAGVIVGVIFAGGAGLSAGRRAVAYLWHAQETAPVRTRAVIVGLAAFALLPLALALVPVPGHVEASGLLVREHETVVRAPSEGFITTAAVSPGQTMTRGEQLVRLESDRVTEKLAVAEANLRAARIRYDAFQAHDPPLARQEAARIEACSAALDQARAEAEGLSIAAPADGVVVAGLDDDSVGRYLQRGDPVATLVAGRWHVRTLLTADQLNRTQARTGTTVEFRPASRGAAVRRGSVLHVAPAGSRTVALLPLTQLADGPIAVDPTHFEATEPYYEVLVDLGADNDCGPGDEAGQSGDCLPGHDSLPGQGRDLRYGMSGWVRIAVAPEPVGTTLVRRLLRFFAKLAGQ